MAIFTAIGGAIAGALFGGSALAASIIGTGLAVGAQLALSYIRRPKKRSYSAVQGSVQFGADVPAGTVYGTSKVKGHRAYYAKWGSGNKGNADVFILANGWCDGLEPYVYFYGEKHNLIARPITGNEVACYGVENYQNDGYDRIVIRFYDGRPGQDVDQQLVNLTANTGNPWKTTSVMAGLVYVVVERTFTSDLFSRGRPDIEFVLRGLREYDPRFDSTVSGGSGPQRLNDPATWVHTNNPAIHRLNYLLGVKGQASGRTLIGLGYMSAQIDYASHMASATVCDTVRNGKPTYAASLYVQADDDHLEVLAEFEDAMAGYAVNRSGLSGVIAGAPQIPVLEITAADIRTDEGQEVQYRRSAFDTFNTLSGQFTSIESHWKPESLKTVFVNADIAADGRRRQNANDFLQVTDPDIAQYLLNIRYRQNRKAGKASLPVSRRVGAKVEPGDWVTFAGKDWLVTRKGFDARVRFRLELAETGADIYDDGEIEPGPIIVPPVAPQNPSLLSNVQDFNVEVGTVAGADGLQVPCLRFTWTPPEDPSINEVRFEYGSGTVPPLDPYEDVSKFPEKGEYVTTKNVSSGLFHVARCTISTSPDRFKSFSNWTITAEATDDLTARADILDNSITAAKIADAAVTADKLMNEAVTSLKLAAEAVTSAKIQTGAVLEAKLAANAVTVGKIADGAVATGKLADAAITNAKLAPLAVDATKLANGAVSVSKLADEAVTNAKLAPLAVDAAKLAANAVTETKIANDAISTPKLQAGAVVADKLAANSVTARSLVLADFSNGFLNPNFDEGLDGWTYSGDYIALIPKNSLPDQPTQNSVRLSFPAPGAVADLIGGKIPVKQGEEYFISVKARFTGGGNGNTTRSFRLYARRYYADGTSAPYSLGAITSNPTWGEVSGKFIISEPEISYLTIGVRLEGGTDAVATTQTLGLTNFVFRKVNGGELIVDGAVTAEKLAANSVVAGKIAADTITARELIVADFTNLVPDNQIQDPSVWSLTGGGVFSQDDIYANAGSKSKGRFVYNSAAATGTAVIRSKVFPVTTGDTLYLEIQAARLGGGTRTGQAAYGFYDENLASLGGGFFGSGFSAETGGFQNQIGEVIVPAGAKFANIGVNIYNNGTAADMVICGPFARIKAGANLIVDGAVIASKLAAGAVIAGKIAAGAITADELAAGSVIAGKIAANAVVAASIAASAVTSDKIAANSVTADKLVANSITARELILTDFANLVPDPHYQVQSLWTSFLGTVWTSGTAVVEGWGVKSKGCYYNNGGQATSGFSEVLRSTQFAVEDRQAYNITWEMRRYNAGQARCRLVARNYDRTGAQISFIAIPGGQINTEATTPVQQSITYTPPVGTVTMQIGVQWDGLNSTSGFIIGYISVRPMRGAELIVDGGITADKIAANAITASKINVSSLSAISATLGSVDISQANIGTLTVGTSNIAPGAVTQVFTAGPYSGSGNSMQLDLTVNHGANSGELVITMSGVGRATAGNGNMRFRGLRAGGTGFSFVIDGIVIGGSSPYVQPASQTIRYTPPAGNTSTALSFIIDRSSGSLIMEASSMIIVCQQLKR